MENGRVRAYFRLVVILCAGILFLSGFSITTNAWAYDGCDYFYEALIDVDNNPSTGGTAFVVQGSETPHSIPGIDYKVRAYLDVGTQKITSINIWAWNKTGNTFDITTTATDYDLGVMNGFQYNSNKADVIEFMASKAALGNPQGPMKIVYHASTATVNDYTDPFYFPQSTSAIPTLSEWGMIVLAVLFGLSAIWVMRKRKAAIGFLVVLGIVLSITGRAWAPPPPQLITLDGQVTDWDAAGVAPAVTDPEGDSSRNDPGEDIVAGFITSDTNNIYFRIDIVGGGSPDCQEPV